MICPSDIWFDSTLSHRVDAGTAGAYLLKRKGDRISTLDAERFALEVHWTAPMTRPVAVDTLDSTRTAAIPAPMRTASPTIKRKRR